MKMTKIFWVCMLAAVFSLTSCIKDSLYADISCDGEVAMTLTTNIQESDAIQSRAITGLEEQKLKEVKIIAFDKDDKFLYLRNGNVTNNNTAGANGSGNATITFTVSATNEKVTFVVIANANSEVETAIGTTAKGVAKATVLGNTGLVKTLSGTTPWNTTSASNYTGIPMHGETSVASISPTGGTASIELKRMLSRIQVKSSVATGTFQLTDVRLFNFNRSGYLLPDKGQITADNLLYSNGSDDHQLYSITSGTTLNGAIYAFERTATTANPVVLIISGKYNGSGSPTHYRVDFRDGTNLINLQRNYSYNVDITSVLGAGYPTVAEAYNSVPMNMTASIAQWDDTNIGGIVFDGVYTLSVTPANFNFNADAHTGNEITIVTDHTAKPTVNFSNSASSITTLTPSGWLTQSAYPDGTTAGGKTTYTYTFNVTANPDASPRTGYIHIQAGRLTYVVKVTQDGDPFAPPAGTMYVGMFGGELKNVSGTYKFERALYIQDSNEGGASVTYTWGPSNNAPTTNDWDGRTNTWNLSSATYPATNVCFSKNSPTPANAAAMVWYLPAQVQLMAAWVAHNSFSSTFYAIDGHWSSSENGTGNAWTVYFTFGNTRSNTKTINSHVRCVREVN